MANPHRQEKLAEQITQEVSDLLRTKVKDPRVGFASITHVEVSGDLRHVKIFVSVMAEEAEKKQTIEALKHATGFIRHELAARLTIRFMPEIIFKLDDSIEKGSHVLNLIRQMQEEESSIPPVEGTEEHKPPYADEVINESE